MVLLVGLNDNWLLSSRFFFGLLVNMSFSVSCFVLLGMGVRVILVVLVLGMVNVFFETLVVV